MMKRLPVPLSMLLLLAALARGQETATHRESLAIAEEGLRGAIESLRRLVETDLRETEQAMERAGAPWTPARTAPLI